jgi:hypothetical protein
MSQKIAGIVVSSTSVQLVILDEDNGDFELSSQLTLNLQVGSRAAAYRVIHNQLQDQLRQADIACTCVKGSAVSMGGTKKAHLEAAELRGVVMAAAAGVCEVRSVSKSATSRNFGGRSVDEYMKDDAFWSGRQLDSIKKGMREAAFVAISQFAES